MRLFKIVCPALVYMSHVAVCAHVVMNADHDCEEEIMNVWCGYNTICNLAQ